MTEEVEPVLARDAADSIALLGGFRCQLGGQPRALHYGAQRIVAFLVLRGPSLSRAFVAGSLWPETTEERAAAALRKHLWKLGPAGRDLVDVDRMSLALNPQITLDVYVGQTRLRRFLDRAPGEVGADELDWIARHVGPATCELLPGWYDDWVLVEQERWRQLRLHALERASALFLLESRWASAVDAALAATAADPYRESAVRLLVEALRAEGNPLAASRAYESFRARVQDELGISPPVDVPAAGDPWLDDVLASHS